MQTLPSFARKYAIMEELDGGFGAGSIPEAFVRLDSWDGRIQASLHVKGLKSGPYAYKLYLIFSKGDRLIPILAGTLNSSYNGMQGGLEIEADVLKSHGLKPDMVRYAAITAESNDRKWIPLFSSFEKNNKWDESIRQILMKKPTVEEYREEAKSHVNEPVNIKSTEQPAKVNLKPAIDTVQQTNENIVPDANSVQIAQQEMPEVNKPVEDNRYEPQYNVPPYTAPNIDSAQAREHENPEPSQDSAHIKANIPGYDAKTSIGDTQNLERHQEKKKVHAARRPFDFEPEYHCCNIDKLEGLLHNNFEQCFPFARGTKGYSWYQVTDLAKLSNIMYTAGVNVPLFANPKILVGFFKYKHILAGLYRNDNQDNYYVIGVPAKNEYDNKPFENACRWVSLNESTNRDMGGYWLVYVSLKTGEIMV